jgi:protein SCO1/2
MNAIGKLAWAAAILATGLLVGWVVAERIPGTKPSLALSEPPRGGDFALAAPNGTFRLEDQRGKVVLIYLGYSFCPDVCPTNLALMTQALNAMTNEELARVQGVFVSVDPERDTLERLETYTGYFHNAIVGVTGEPAELARIAARYGAAYHRIEGESAGGYLIDHSSNTYVIAPDGSLHDILPHAVAPQRILDVTRGLLADFPSNS